ncbi:MAG: winged helix-turn-helix domain-containing protein, partial [Bacteroidaceae bacterium]|nr:winged helix-turn-helix domain-containing protein [Bacteroidaceae bacterium]
ADTTQDTTQEFDLDTNTTQEMVQDTTQEPKEGAITTQETNQGTKTTKETTQHLILAEIKSNPNITQKELAQSLGLSLDGIRYHIKKMTKLGFIKHEGATKSGRWITSK